MTNITFIDLEVNPVNRQILDMGAIRNDGVPFHANSPAQFIQFITQTEYIGGHNILNHQNNRYALSVPTSVSCQTVPSFTKG